MASSKRPSPLAALSAAIRAQRKALGLTQQELARLAGCGPDFIYDLESGKPTVRLDKLLDVLAVMGLELRLDAGKRVLSVADRLARTGA